MASQGEASRWGRWQSLRVRLPLTISLVVIVILAVVLFTAYRQVESALVAAGLDRARAASGQVAALIEAQLRAPIAQVRLAASEPALREYLKSRDPAKAGAAEAELRKLLRGTPPRSVTLWDNGKQRVLEVQLAAAQGGNGPQALPPEEPPSSEGWQPLRTTDDGAFLSTSALVSDLYPTHAALGYVVATGAFAVNPPGMLARLVGGDATVLLANRDGSEVVDLATARRVAGPAAVPADGRYERDRLRRIVAAAPIGDTPFDLRVEFSERVILASGRQFLQRMILFGVLAAIASAILIRMLTVREMRPLAELTAVTEAMAAGDYSRHVGAFRQDEVGRLARAFDAMTTKVAADITERERIARALQENEERLRYTLSAARVGTWQMALDTGIVEWSETMGPLFGVQSSALPSQRERVLDVIHADDRAEVDACLMRERGDQQEHEIFFRALQPDGNHKWVVGRSRLATDSAGVSRLVGVCIDVTEQKLLEQQLRQAQKMDAIGKLAGGVAHDFNNLLTAILGFATLLHEGFAPGDARRSQVDAILQAGKRAADLTAQLLAFSRQQLVQPIIVNVKSAVDEAMVLLGRLIGENIQLQSVFTPEQAKVRIDPGQLQQILMNLAINARDAMREGGRLTIEVSVTELDEAYGGQHIAIAPGRYVMIAVSDTGIGMSEAVRMRLFEPFFTTKPRGEGTGLGLATVYGAVKQAGGYVWAYSEPKQGSTFKVYLPRVSDDQPAAAAPLPVLQPEKGSETILLVEDEDGVRLLTRMILERAGYRVILAASAEEAEQTHLQFAGSIALLITDVVLPGSSGPDLYKRLSIRDPKLKVLYMSGYTDDAVFRTGRLEQGVSFVQKPFTAVELQRKIRETLNG